MEAFDGFWSSFCGRPGGRLVRNDELAGFENSLNNLKAVCREGRAADVPAATAALLRYEMRVDTGCVVAEAASAGHEDVVVALFRILYGGTKSGCLDTTVWHFLATVAERAGRAGHGSLLQWALRTAKGRACEVCPSEVLGFTGRLDMLRLLESSADTAAALSQEQALRGACRGRQVAVVRWALDCLEQQLRDTGHVRWLWTAVADMSLGMGTAEVDGTIWRMLVGYAAGAGLPGTYMAMYAFEAVCKGNKVTLAQLIFHHSQAVLGYDLRAGYNKEINRLCSKYAPDVARWLYTLDPTLAHWSDLAKARVEDMMAVPMMPPSIMTLRLAWLAAIVRQWRL